MRREDIVRACASAQLVFRPEVLRLLSLAEAADVPVLVFSAGIADVIEEMFRQRLPGGRLPPNVHVVSNRMVFGADGLLSGWHADLIHMFNKTEIHLRGSPIYGELLRRRNVLLCGDGLGDCMMAAGLPHETVLRIGIINSSSREAAEAHLPAYRAAFDCVVVDSHGVRPLLDVAEAVLGVL